MRDTPGEVPVVSGSRTVSMEDDEIERLVVDATSVWDEEKQASVALAELSIQTSTGSTHVTLDREAALTAAERLLAPFGMEVDDGA